ncbi:MAG: hypothetical protein JRJ65_14900 [Deltaproteobacteria bacterium]|nr:hypothetical protein [Deltaproteobacteria bacterium]
MFTREYARLTHITVTSSVLKTLVRMGKEMLAILKSMEHMIVPRATAKRAFILYDEISFWDMLESDMMKYPFGICSSQILFAYDNLLL